MALLAIGSAALGAEQRLDADIITVDDDGPADYSDIQSAVDAASDGDMILIEAGTYTADDESSHVVDLLGKELDLIGFDAKTTIIDGRSVRGGMLANLADAQAVSIRGIGFLDCRGAAIKVVDGRLTIEDCRMTASFAGSAVDSVGSTLLVAGCRFEGNLAAYGAAIRGQGIELTVADSEFLDNQATLEGGAIALAVGSSSTISDCTFTSNAAGPTSLEYDPNGGAIHVLGGSHDISGCSFTNNIATERGGAIRSDGDASLSITATSFTGNTSRVGGALECAGGLLGIDHCTFTANTCSGSGSAVFASSTEVTAIDCQFTDNLGATGIVLYAYDTVQRFVGCTVQGNGSQTRGLYGGGIFASFQGGTGALELEACVVTGNSALVSAGVFCSGEVRMKDTVICANRGSQLGLLSLVSEPTYVDLGGNCIQNQFIDADGDGLPECATTTDSLEIHVPAEYPTLVEAVDAAPVGAVIHLAAGDHPVTSEIDLLGKGLELRGTTDEAGLPLSRLIGSGGHRLLNQCGGVFDEQVRIRDLVISKGDNPYLWFGGASLCFQGCEMDLDNVEVRESTNGACRFDYCTVTATNSRFVDNLPGPEDEAGSSFGFYFQGTDSLFEGCSILRNGGAGFNAGQGGEHLLVACEVADNQGNGVLAGAGSSGEVRASVICGNDGSQMSGSFVDGGDNCISTACGDSDGDGIDDCLDECPEDPDKIETGICGCGVPDVDSDGDGLLDCQELSVPGDYDRIQDAIAAAIPGSRIEIGAGTWTPGEVLDLSGKALHLKGTVDTEGNPATFVDGAGSHRIAQCIDNGTTTVTFENLVIQNGSAPEGAGLWCRNSNVALVNCSFLANAASDEGGGLYAEGISALTSIQLDSCSFMANSAVRGGGICTFAYASSLGEIGSIDLDAAGCIFAGNVASDQGGGFFNITYRYVTEDLEADSARSQLDFEDCLFDQNSSGPGGGGAIWLRAASNGHCDLRLAGTDFIGNTASTGGALEEVTTHYSYGSPGLVSTVLNDCTFTGNSAELDGGARKSWADAGGIFTTVDTNVTYDGNTAGVDGGAWWVYANRSRVEIGNETCTFTNNSAGDDGGARYTYLTGDSPEASISELNAVYQSNSAEGNGGAHSLWLNAGTAVITRSACTYQMNSAVDGGGWHEYVAGGSLEHTATGSECTGNVATRYGGFRYSTCFSSGSSTRLEHDALYLNNTANYGGAIYESNSSVGGPASWSYVDTVFSGNTSAFEGGAVHARSSGAITTVTQLAFEGCSFTENRSVTDGEGRGGGGFYAADFDALSTFEADFTRCTFTANEGKFYGAGLYARNLDGTATETDFTANAVVGNGAYGGGAYLLGGTWTLDDCQFLNNSASDEYSVHEGGGLRSSAALTVKNSLFKGNTAPSGGALTHSGPTVLTNCRFEDNHATLGVGGAVESHTSAGLTMTGSTFEGNMASTDGGAIYLETGTVDLSTSHFEGNLAGGNGGGLACRARETGTQLQPNVSDCSFIGNVAGGFGGGVDSRSPAGAACAPLITNCTIRGNQAISGGGGVYSSLNGPTILSGTTVCENLPDQILNEHTDADANCISTSCGDSDEDGTLDCNDQCPDDPLKIDPGLCGCGVPDTDTDLDGSPDCLDECPDDPEKTEPGICGCGAPDLDSDGDGVLDCFDQCPGIPDEDTDGDGIADCIDPCPEWAGDCSEDGTTLTVLPGDSIELALSLVPESGTVLLAAGVHTPPATISLGGRPVMLRGERDPETGDLLTTLDGEGERRLIAATPAPGIEIVVQELVFSSGFAQEGGAVLVESGGVLFERCRFEMSTATDAGGAVVVSGTGTAPAFVECSFIDNQASFGGAVSNTLFSEPTFTACLFTGNQAETGGAIYNAFASTPMLEDCTIRDNQAAAMGLGGGVFSAPSCDMLLATSTVCGNSPDQIEGPYEDGGDNCIGESCVDCGLPPLCIADLNGDGTVDGTDLTLLLGNWECTDDGCVGDIDDDGMINGLDLTILLGEWGLSCEG